MKLVKIILENFRQFYGTQEIDFGIRDGNDEKSVVVVFGENGRGKTGLFRALIFCLFGEYKLRQDGDINTEEIKLVNKYALELNKGKPVKTSVQLFFIHGENYYELSRSIRSLLLEGEKTIEQPDKLEMRVTTPDGNTRFLETDRINEEVNSILDRRVKDYFLFDGERIEHLMRAGREQRKEVREGIRNLLKIDILEKSIRGLKVLNREMEEEFSSSNADTELSRLMIRSKECEEALKDNENQRDNLEKELEAAEKQISDIDKKLKEIEGVRALLHKRASAEEKFKENEIKMNEMLKDMKKYVCGLSYGLVFPTISKVFSSIEEQKKKGEIPSEIRRDLIERIIKEGKCICGNDVCKDSAAYKEIYSWLSRTKDVKTQDIALQLWRYLSGILGEKDKNLEFVEKLLQNYSNLRNDNEVLSRKIEEISSELGSAKDTKISSSEKQREGYIKTKYSLEQKYNNFVEVGESLSAEIESLKSRIKSETLKASLNNELSNRIKISSEALDIIEEIRSSFVNDVKEEISFMATEIFQKLIDSEMPLSVVVGEDYTLEVLDRYSSPFLANISAGQRQILSISFIISLACIASSSEYINIPLFMDSPFGRLSFEHRKNLIDYIPTAVSQWVILTTDTELRKREANLLMKTNKWGRFFRLKSVDNGNTQIEKIDISQAMIYFREEEV